MAFEIFVYFISIFDETSAFFFLFVFPVPPSSVNVIAEETSMNLSWVPGERQRNIAFMIHYQKETGEKREEQDYDRKKESYERD